MKTSHEGVKVIQFFEGCKLYSYPDPGSVDGKPWTIGWGHTGTDVFQGLIWSQDMADKVFIDDLLVFEKGILSLVNHKLNQGQFDALVSFSYNVGLGALTKSTLLSKINAKDYCGASLEFIKWNKSGGKVMLGLTRRRIAEQALFNGSSGAEAVAIAKSYSI